MHMWIGQHYFILFNKKSNLYNTNTSATNSAADKPITFQDCFERQFLHQSRLKPLH
jgi:hypothetical protein